MEEMKSRNSLFELAGTGLVASRLTGVSTQEQNSPDLQVLFQAWTGHDTKTRAHVSP